MDEACSPITCRDVVGRVARLDGANDRDGVVRERPTTKVASGFDLRLFVMISLGWATSSW